jgi:acetyl esterase
MPLDPHAQALLDEVSALGQPPYAAMSPSDARQAMRVRLANVDEAEAVARIEDHFIPCPAHQIPVRLYLPAASAALPVLVYFHGGGWVIGGIDTHDHFCRHLANAAACAVASVDYRLAPEHKFPTGLEDCYTAVLWIITNANAFNIDSSRIAVGGDSAGGNLAAAITLLARDRGGPDLSYQVLIYPVTDYWIPSPPSYLKLGVGYSLTRDSMIWFWHHYLPSGVSPDNPYLCPLRAPSLEGVPPAFVITAEYDPLLDEGERYVERLKDAGVQVVLKRYDGMMHGFCHHYKRFIQARQLVNDIADALPWKGERRSG